MSDVHNDIDEAVDAELIEVEEVTVVRAEAGAGSDLLVGPDGRTLEPASDQRERNSQYVRYLVLPFIFLTVSLLGGLRIDSLDGAFIFVRPALVCLIFGAALLVLFARASLIRLDGWFSETFPPLKNAANAAVLATLFAAATQVFNSLVPERGLPFWVVVFCFIWTLWTNLFADFDPRKLLRSLGGLFGLAFVAKYLILANLTAPAGRTWFEALTENPGQEAITRLLDLPRYDGSTGYIQFFAVGLFLLGLYLFPSDTRDN